MSSTNRGAIRNESDYYATPGWAIAQFLRAWPFDDNVKHVKTILDPCAGGTADKDGQPLVGMAYRAGLSESRYIFPNWDGRTDTMDIRLDSLADHRGVDYLQADTSGKYDLIITNPPFCLAQEIITKAIKDVRGGGFVVMLLRLNFFGGQERSKWIHDHMPHRAYVHGKRMGFNWHRSELTPAKRNATDSIEYMHAVWHKNDGCGISTRTELRVLPPP